jgi:[ribosomal protein S18]-alanine N-acetyltransferase
MSADLPPLVRPMRVEDLDAVYAAQGPADDWPWSKAQIIAEFSNPRARQWVLERSHSGTVAIVAFALFWLVHDEVHVLNIAVHPFFRRQGNGSLLLRHLIADARQRCSDCVLLEVRASNLAAQRLYATLGFVPTGLRKAYYQSNGEDAVLMRLSLN